MIFITVWMFVREGKEATFLQYEEVALKIVQQYRGELIFRMRPDRETMINKIDRIPYEIHILSFPSREDFDEFKSDPERQKIAYLFKESVEEAVLIEGYKPA